MYQYKVLGYILESPYKLKQLPESTSNGRPDCTVIFEKLPLDIQNEIEASEKRHFLAPDYAWFINKYADFAIFKDGRIYVDIKNCNDIDFLFQFILGYCISIYAHLNDRMVLHCGAVTDGEYAHIICGISGSGKSTVVSHLIDQGLKLLGDDIAGISLKDCQPIVYPAYPQQKLCRNEVTEKGLDPERLVYIDPTKDKFAINCSDVFCEDTKPLKEIIIIKRYNPNAPDYAYLECQAKAFEIKGFEKFNQIAKNLFVSFLIPNFISIPKQFKTLADIASNVRIYLLYRPSDINTKEETMEIVDNLLTK